MSSSRTPSRAAAARRAPPSRVVALRRTDTWHLYPLDDVVSIEADHDVVHVHTGDGQRTTLTCRLRQAERSLDPERFLRISRAAIVNVSWVQSFQAATPGTLVARLRDGRELHVSRLCARRIRRQLLHSF
jgi:DNA-binding LytR/AlgR family response regulator